MIDPREDAMAAADAMRQVGEDLRRRNRLLGLPLVIWRDGRVQHVDATTLQPIPWPPAVKDDGPLPLPPES
jgi:hypothetical protein